MLSVAEKKPKATLLKAVGDDYVTVSPDMRAADWLEAQIAKSRNGVVSQIAEMTPALARVLLNRNDGNRKISDAIVTSYARDMVHGAWQFNGEPVIVSADGKLNDGQHRCEAVVRADVSIPALFVFGVERATRTTLDQGKIRTVGDFLSMGGHANTNHLGAAANLAWQYLAHGQLSSGGSNRATKSEILAFVEVNPNIVTSVSFVQQKGADAVGGRPTLGFVHWALWQKAGRQKADGFINNLIDGADLNHRSPILNGTKLDTTGYLDKLKGLTPNDQVAAARRDLADIRQKERAQRGSANAAKLQADVKARAAREVAGMIAEHIPGEWWDAVKSNLYAAGAKNIGDALTNITGEAIMDRSAA